MDDSQQHDQRPRGRLISLAAASLVFVAGLVFALTGVDEAAGAISQTFHGEEITIAVPTENGTGYVRIHMLLADDGNGGFDDVVAEARANAIAGFPTGFVIKGGGEVSAAFSVFTLWNPPTADWKYNSDNEPIGIGDVQGEIQAGANSWDGVGGSPWSFTGGGATSDTVNPCVDGAGDGKNVVAWSAGSLGGSTLASTCTWFGAFASEFDMQFSAVWNWTIGSPVDSDLRTVAVHEFGHALGLLHTQGSNCPGTSMCSTYSSGSVTNQPQADDINGVVFLYGGDAVPPTPTPGGPTNTPTSAAPPPPPPTSTPTPEDDTPTPTPTLAPGETPTETSTPTNTPTAIPGGGGASPPKPAATRHAAPPPGGGATPTPEAKAFILPALARD